MPLGKVFLGFGGRVKCLVGAELLEFVSDYSLVRLTLRSGGIVFNEMKLYEVSILCASVTLISP